MHMQCKWNMDDLEANCFGLTSSKLTLSYNLVFEYKKTKPTSFNHVNIFSWYVNYCLKHH